MSTTFKIMVDDKSVEIARRNSIGNGKVKITWLNPLAKFLDNRVDVYPTDNTAQGVMYLEDLKVLDKYQSFDNIQQTKDILLKTPYIDDDIIKSSLSNKQYTYRYKIGETIINNNGGIKTMLNKIKKWIKVKIYMFKVYSKEVKNIKWLNAYKKTLNSIDKNVIKNVLKIANNSNKIKTLTNRIDDNYDKLDYRIISCERDLNDCDDYCDKLNKKINNVENDLNDYLIHIFKFDKKIEALQGNINALTTAHNMLNEEHRELRKKHNKLGLDVSVKNDNIANDIMNDILYKVAPEHIKNKALSIIKKHINLSN